MSILRLVNSVKDSALNVLKAAIDAGAGPGTIKIYTGAMPTLPADPVTTQTLLGTLTFSDPCGAVSGQILTMSAITQDASADATGTATWARIADSTGATVMDIDVTNTGGGGTLQLNTVNIVVGGPILITAATITIP